MIVIIKECHVDFCAAMISCTLVCILALLRALHHLPSSARCGDHLSCSFSSGMRSYEQVRGKSTTQQEAQVFSSSSVWSVVQRFLIEGYFHPLKVNSLLCLDFSFSFLRAGSETLQGFLPNSIQREKDHFECLLCTSRRV